MKKSKKYMIIIPIFLILVICFAIYGLHKFDRKAAYEILLFTDTGAGLDHFKLEKMIDQRKLVIESIEFDGNNFQQAKKVKEIPYPYEKSEIKVGEGNAVRSLIRTRDPEKWLFLDKISVGEPDWLCFDLTYKNRKVRIDNLRKIMFTSSGEFFLYALPEKKSVLSDMGIICYLETNSFDFLNWRILANLQDDIKDKEDKGMPIFTGGIFHRDGSLTCQGYLTTRTADFPYRNFLSRYNPELKNVLNIKSGYNLLSYFDPDQPAYSPIGLSKDEKIVYFWSQSYIDKKMGIVLNQWDLDKNLCSKLYCPDDTRYNVPYFARTVATTYGFIETSPDKNSSLIAVNLSNDILIIDTVSGKLYAKIPAEELIVEPRARISHLSIRTMKWSPDGRYLGVLLYDGSLYLYDIKTKNKLSALKDSKLFDFIWSNTSQ